MEANKKSPTPMNSWKSNEFCHITTWKRCIFRRTEKNMSWWGLFWTHLTFYSIEWRRIIQQISQSLYPSLSHSFWHRAAISCNSIYQFTHLECDSCRIHSFTEQERIKHISHNMKSMHRFSYCYEKSKCCFEFFAKINPLITGKWYKKCTEYVTYIKPSSK